MNMFFHEMKQNRKFTILWSGAISAWIILISLFYPAFSDNAGVITNALESYPEAVRSLIGLSPDSLSSYLGFYSFVFNGVLEVGMIQAVILGASMVFKEVSGKTADFLFSKPVTRKEIMTAKLSAAGASLVITTFISFIVSGIMASTISSEIINGKVLFMVCFTLLFVQLIFMSFGILIAAVFPHIKSATAIAIGALLLSEIVFSIFKPVIGENAVRYLIPLKYFSSVYIIKNAAYETAFVLLTILLIVVSLAAGYAVYIKKDVHAA